MKYYVYNSTIQKYVYFNSVPELVTYLSTNLVPRATGLNRQQFAQNFSELGYGEDDREGVTLTRVLSETYDIGIVRNNTHLRTDVHAATRFNNEGYGD